MESKPLYKIRVHSDSQEGTNNIPEWVSVVEELSYTDKIVVVEISKQVTSTEKGLMIITEGYNNIVFTGSQAYAISTDEFGENSIFKRPFSHDKATDQICFWCGDTVNFSETQIKYRAKPVFQDSVPVCHEECFVKLTGIIERFVNENTDIIVSANI